MRLYSAADESYRPRILTFSRQQNCVSPLQSLRTVPGPLQHASIWEPVDLELFRL